MCSRRPDLSCAADRATADAQMYKNDWLGKERQRSEIRISMYSWQPNLIGTPWVIYLQNLTQESWKENIPICRNMMKHIYWNYRFGHDHHPPWKPWRLNNLAIITIVPAFLSHSSFPLLIFLYRFSPHKPHSQPAQRVNVCWWGKKIMERRSLNMARSFDVHKKKTACYKLRSAAT